MNVDKTVINSEEADIEVAVEEKFLEMLYHHLEGWRQKVSNDFSKESFEQELNNLSGDKVYVDFGLATPQYVMIRLIGRMSISIGRRLGEIYDKIPRFIVMARFNLTLKQVVVKMQNLELDVQILKKYLREEDKEHIIKVAQKYNVDSTTQGLGIEIRYNFNPNDSARLRKDVDMAQYLIEAGVTPVYLIFSNISPREEAIARLKRAGWTFLIGDEAISFMKELAGLDLASILTKDKTKQLINQKISQIMDDIYTSYGLEQCSKIKRELSDS